MSVFRNLMMREKIIYNGATTEVGYRLNYNLNVGDTIVFSYRVISDIVELESSTTFLGFRLSQTPTASSGYSLYTISNSFKLYFFGSRETIYGLSAKSGDTIIVVLKVVANDSDTYTLDITIKCNDTILDKSGTSFNSTSFQIYNVSMNPTYIGNVKVTKA